MTSAPSLPVPTLWRCSGSLGKAALLMPPGTRHHISPGAVQRRLAVEALWHAFYQHIWLRKISVLLDPRKMHIICTLKKRTLTRTRTHTCTQTQRQAWEICLTEQFAWGKEKKESHSCKQICTRCTMNADKHANVKELD